MGPQSETVPGEQCEAPSDKPSAPIENSPPGIQTMPAGGGPGGADELAIVGENELGEGSAALAVRTTASRENAPGMSFMIRFAPDEWSRRVS